jgi:hypothetical protein
MNLLWPPSLPAMTTREKAEEKAVCEHPSCVQDARLVAKCSLVSKRWQQMCSRVQTLHFYSGLFKGHNDYEEIVRGMVLKTCELRSLQVGPCRRAPSIDSRALSYSSLRHQVARQVRKEALEVLLVEASVGVCCLCTAMCQNFECLRPVKPQELLKARRRPTLADNQSPRHCSYESGKVSSSRRGMV